GRAGLQAAIREHVRLARLFASWVEAEPGWEIAAPYPFSTVCFRVDASDEENEALLERVNRSGEAFLSGARLAGRQVLRLAAGSAGRARDRRHALRHLGDGLELDRALRLWNGGAHQVRVTRAVVFDLWDTLVDFDVEGSIAVQTAMAKRLGRDPEEFRRAWNDT